MYIECIFAELNVQNLDFGLVGLRTGGPSDWWTFGLVGGHLIFNIQVSKLIDRNKCLCVGC
jgi:hypothetical protein